MAQVYVIGTNIGIVKIGVSTNSQKRLYELQRQMQRERPDISLSLLHVEVFECALSCCGDPWSRDRDVERAKDVERAAHDYLAAKWLPYEWFVANGLFDTRYLAPTEWFEATADEAFYAVKAGVLQPLLPAARAPAVPTARFEDLFGIALPAHLEDQEARRRRLELPVVGLGQRRGQATCSQVASGAELSGG